MLRRLAIACAGILLVSSQAAGSIFEQDDRVLAPKSPDSLYAPIGTVRTSALGKQATGFLIDACHALTVQHVFGERRSALGEQATFTAGQSTGRPLRSRGTVVAAGGMNQHGRSSFRDHPAEYVKARVADWAVIRLDRCIGRTLGAVRLSAKRADIASFSSAGFPGHAWTHSGLVIDPSCQIRATTRALWLNDCAALPGNSGGPIFRERLYAGGIRLEVYAIQSAGMHHRRVRKFATMEANVATPVAEILPGIQKALGRERVTVRL